MITFIQCVKKRPEISLPEFRRYWTAYQTKAAELAKAVNAVGLSFSTTLAVDENLQLMLIRGTSEPFEGVVQFRISNAPRMIERLAAEPAKTIWEDFRRLQKEFIDFEASSFFFASEETVIRR